LLVLALGACGWTDPDPDYGTPPDEPLEIATAVTGRAAAPIDWDRPLGPTGFYQGDAWPPACDLLTDQEVTAVLPQATVAARVPDDQEFDVIGLGGTGGHVTAAGSTCTIELDIPAAGLPHAMRGEPPRIEITIDAAGTTGIVSGNFHPSGARLPTAAGACFDDQIGLSCRADHMAFRLAAHLPDQQAGPAGWTNRYRHAGRTTTFAGRGSMARAEATRRREAAFELRALDLPLAGLVLAKA
jgi:hypothetical protein